MADAITLPPLPIRSCIVTYMGDGRGLHYTLGVAAGTALIEQPPGSQLDLYTADQLRARDRTYIGGKTLSPMIGRPTSSSYEVESVFVKAR